MNVLKVSHLPFLFFMMKTVSAEVSHLNFLLGSDGYLNCTSSFTPAWSKTGSAFGDYNIISVNGKRHPNWDEPRYSFSTNGNVFSLHISDLRLTDAGKFVCASDAPKTFLVTILR